MSAAGAKMFIIIAIISYSKCSNATETIPDHTTTKESQLIAKILATTSEDRYSRPRPEFNSTAPTIIEVRAYLVRVLDVDSEQQSFSIFAYLEMGWVNERLKWDQATFDGIGKIVTNAKNLWVPDIGLLNRIPSEYKYTSNLDLFSLNGEFDFSQKKKDMNVMVLNTGWIKWYLGGIYNVGCHLDLTYFPFDTQTCSFYFISWMYSYSELQLKAMKGKMDITFIPMAEWDILNISVTNRTVYFKPGDVSSKWSLLEVKITCSREPRYYVTNVIVPAIIISVLGMTVFLLPCDSGEKVSLGISVLLAFSVFQLVIIVTLPRNSKSTPYIVIYLTTLTITTAITTLMSVVVLSIHHTGSERKISPFMKFIIFNILRRVTRYCRRTTQRDRSPYLKGKSYIKTDCPIDMTPSQKAETEGNPGKLEKLLQEILKENKKMNARKVQHESESETVKEWEDAAKIVDRFLMMLYIVAVTSITLTFVGILPANQQL